MSVTKESKLDSTGNAERRRAWQSKPILSPELTEDPPLEDAYVAVVKERRNTSHAIQSISAILPLSGSHPHLKRCSSDRLLLAPVSCSPVFAGRLGDVDELSAAGHLKEYLRERGFDLSLLQDRLEVRKVPARAPRTKAQASRAAKLWPVNFHPEPGLESLLDGSIFAESEALAIEGYMGLAIRAARAGPPVGNADCNGTAVIVDPADGRILAVAASRIDLHPMWHASMIAIDLVAEEQGGGAWALLPGRRAASTDSAGCCLPRRRKRKHGELSSPLFYPDSLASVPLPTEAPFSRNNVLRGSRGRNGSDEDARETESSAYLCTGYWAFLLREPCTLCAMALLHSRVSRIFYGLKNERAGVLGSRAILHGVPGLNHRYQVWRGILEEECDRTFREMENSAATAPGSARSVIEESPASLIPRS